MTAKPRFADVARSIADPPPEWLAMGLEQFAEFIGADQLTSDDGKETRAVLQRMHDAADLLMKYLPALVFTPAGIGPREDVTAALGALPGIKKDIARALDTRRVGGGPKPNIQRQFCAAVVVEAAKLMHGKMPPKETLIANACNEYWQACGGEYRGDDYAGAWRRDIEQAVSDNQEWIRRVLIGVRDSHSIA
jgi:hypothetical protein